MPSRARRQQLRLWIAIWKIGPDGFSWARAIAVCLLALAVCMAIGTARGITAAGKLHIASGVGQEKAPLIYAVDSK